MFPRTNAAQLIKALKLSEEHHVEKGLASWAFLETFPMYLITRCWGSATCSANENTVLSDLLHRYRSLRAQSEATRALNTVRHVGNTFGDGIGGGHQLRGVHECP